MSGALGLSGVALRLVLRSPGKAYTRLLLLAAVAFILSGALFLERGVSETAERGAGRLGYDLMMLPGETDIAVPGTPLLGVSAVRAPLPAGVVAAVAARPDVAAVAPRYLAETVADPCCEAGDLLLVGFDQARDRGVLAWLPPGDRPHLNANALLIGGRVLKAPGAVIRLYGHPFRVAGRLAKSGNSQFDGAIFMPLEGLQAMEHASHQGNAIPFAVAWDRPSLFMVRLSPTAEPGETAAALQREFPGIQVVAAPAPIRSERQRLNRAADGVRSLAWAAWPAALLAGGALMVLVIGERRRSLGLLRSLGCRPALLVLFIGVEALLLSVLAMALGRSAAAVAVPLLGAPVTEALGLAGPTFPAVFPGPAGEWLLFGVTLAAVSVVSVSLLLRREPAALLRP